MGIFGLLGLIAIAGVVCWFLLTLNMPAIFKNLIVAVVSIFVIIVILNFFGVHIPGMNLK